MGGLKFGGLEQQGVVKKIKDVKFDPFLATSSCEVKIAIMLCPGRPSVQTALLVGHDAHEAFYLLLYLHPFRHHNFLKKKSPQHR